MKKLCLSLVVIILLFICCSCGSESAESTSLNQSRIGSSHDIEVSDNSQTTSDLDTESVPSASQQEEIKDDSSEMKDGNESGEVPEIEVGAIAIGNAVIVGEGDTGSPGIVSANTTESASNATPVLTPVYEDENCLINFYRYRVDNGRHYVDFRVSNYTNRTLTFQSDCISFNGESINDITFSDDVSPNSDGTISMRISNFDESNFNFSQIAFMSGNFTIIDFNDDNFHNGSRYYEVKYMNVEIPCEEYVAVSVNEGQQFYSDDRVAIAYLETRVEEDKTYVRFRVKNFTEDVITIQCESLGLNGESASDVIGSESVAPYSAGNIEMKLEIDTSFVNLDEITSMTGCLRIIAFENDNFYNGERSYEVSF